MSAPRGASKEDLTMSKLRLTASFVTVALTALVVACSSDEGGDKKSSPSSGESTRSGSGDESEPGGSTTTTGTTCSSSATNGKCDEGPKKGSDCCMDGDECASGTSCQEVCKVCE